MLFIDNTDMKITIIILLPVYGLDSLEFTQFIQHEFTSFCCTCAETVVKVELFPT